MTSATPGRWGVTASVIAQWSPTASGSGRCKRHRPRWRCSPTTSTSISTSSLRYFPERGVSTLPAGTPTQRLESGSPTERSTAPGYSVAGRKPFISLTEPTSSSSAAEWPSSEAAIRSPGPWVCDREGASARSLNLSEWGTLQGSANFDPVGSYLVFAATDSDGDRELWRSDGTTEGSARLADIFPGGSSAPEHFFAFNGRALFTAIDAIHGRELWITDGTSAGTTLVADIAPGLTSSSPADFRLSHGAVVFTAGTTANGRELWVTAGTPGSTQMLADANPGPASSSPAEITPTSGRIFFRATDSHGAELWAACPGWGVAAELATAVVTEGAGMLAVAVHLTVPAACGGGRFLLEAHSGSATAGVDFTAEPQTVTFIAGALDVVMAVPVLDDALPEDGETFRLVLRDVLGRIVAEAEGLIVDDDGGADADGDGIAWLPPRCMHRTTAMATVTGRPMRSSRRWPRIRSPRPAAGLRSSSVPDARGCRGSKRRSPRPTPEIPPIATRTASLASWHRTARRRRSGSSCTACPRANVRAAACARSCAAIRRRPDSKTGWLSTGQRSQPSRSRGTPVCALNFRIEDGGPGDLSPAPRESTTRSTARPPSGPSTR